ncbi:MAG: selenocysteine-specific translation elongation factor [bacterium]
MHVVVGTAGHIDHGKSALVRALTGTDPDRLKEEKERGMTTDLGFAFLSDSVTIIDVPGHEKFVRHMLAGASTIDVVVLVVAADDGVMPQTREHFDICRLMGIERGMVVINKADLADADWLELVRDDVAELVRGSFLEGAPVIAASAATGQGVEEVRAALEALVAQVRGRKDRGVFRMPVDRSFIIKGFGTVVAGTVLSGSCRVGDRLELLPGRHEVRVRGIQRHNLAVGEARVGDRAALNLQGLAREDVARGFVVATPGYYMPTDVLNGTLALLAGPERPLRNMTRVRVHIGTSEVMGRAVLLDRKQLAPGEEGLVQLRLEEPVVCDWNDHYVLRSYSPQHTIGGGVVLEPGAVRERRFDAATIARLEAQSTGDSRAVLEQALARDGLEARQPDQLARALVMVEADFAAHLSALEQEGRAVRFRFEGRDYVVHAENLARARAAVVAATEEFHRESPFRVGLKRPELRARAGRGFSVPLFEHVTGELVEAGELVDEAGRLRRPGHQIRLVAEEQALFDSAAAAVRAGRFSPPDLAETMAGARKAVAERVRTALFETGVLVDVGEGVVFHRDAISEAREVLTALFAKSAELAATEVRQALGTTRRYAIPLLNHFDSTGLTQRRGDKRVLRRVPVGDDKPARRKEE